MAAQYSRPNNPLGLNVATWLKKIACRAFNNLKLQPGLAGEFHLRI